MNKKKIALLAMSLCMIAILAVGGSLAYLTDTDNQTNTFTAGHVFINLDETEVVEDAATGNLVTNGVRTEVDQEYDLHPNMYVDKDPTITLHEESEPSYIGAIVTVKGGKEGNLYNLYGVNGFETLNIHQIVTGGEGTMIADNEGKYGDYGTGEKKIFVFQNENYAIHQVPDKENNTWTFYIFCKNVVNPGESVTLFHKLVISPDFNNVQMKNLKDMSIKVQAYGVQAHGFCETDGEGNYVYTADGCYNALTEAFEDWNFGNNFEDVNELLAKA